MKVLHVTEATGAGVLASMLALARAQVDHGVQVRIIIVLRTDSPTKYEIESMAGDEIDIVFLSSQGMNLRTAKQMALAILLNQRAPDKADYVHYHSTFAGIIGRIMSSIMLSSSRTFYSPHGFAFLRQDVRAFVPFGLRILERMLHTLGSNMVLVSNSEMSVARTTVGAKRIHLLENGLDIGLLPPKPSSPATGLLVGTAARVVHQKAPWKFARLAQQMGSIQFLWIGGGDESDQAAWLGDSGIEITGWLSPEKSVAQIASLDVYISTALWEGLPMSVIQAQALGIPCVVSAVVGHADIVIDCVTGYICETEDEMLTRLEQLVSNPTLRATMGQAAKTMARERFDSRRLGKQSIAIYSKAKKVGYSATRSV